MGKIISEENFFKPDNQTLVTLFLLLIIIICSYLILIILHFPPILQSMGCLLINTIFLMWFLYITLHSSNVKLIIQVWSLMKSGWAIVLFKIKINKIGVKDSPAGEFTPDNWLSLDSICVLTKPMPTASRNKWYAS